MTGKELKELVNKIPDEQLDLVVFACGPTFDGKFGPCPVIGVRPAYKRSRVTGDEAILWIETTMVGVR